MLAYSFMLSTLLHTMANGQNSTAAAAAAAAAAAVAASASNGTESATTSSEQNPNPFVSFFSNLFGSILKFKLPPLPFLPPQKNQFIDAASSDSVQSNQATSGVDGGPYEESCPRSVSFPRHGYVPLKLEADDVEARETKPGTIWMAYAIGGYLIASWAWTRWNERRTRRNPSDDRPPPNSE